MDFGFEIERTPEEIADEHKRMDREAMEIFIENLHAFLDDHPGCSAAELVAWIEKTTP